MMTYENQVNAGNYGVLYRVKLENVAPHTLIAFNSAEALTLEACL